MMRFLLLTGGALLLLITSVVSAGKPEGAGTWIEGKDKEDIQLMMRSVNKALGVKCNHCHVRKEGKFQYDKWTPRKRVALFMYLNYVRKLQRRGGKSLSCRTCHRGKASFLKKIAKGG